jgi:hypothetical protein
MSHVIIVSLCDADRVVTAIAACARPVGFDDIQPSLHARRHLVAKPVEKVGQHYIGVRKVLSLANQDFIRRFSVATVEAWTSVGVRSQTAVGAVNVVAIHPTDWFSAGVVSNIDPRLAFVVRRAIKHQDRIAIVKRTNDVTPQEPS